MKKYTAMFVSLAISILLIFGWTSGEQGYHTAAMYYMNISMTLGLILIAIVLISVTAVQKMDGTDILSEMAVTKFPAAHLVTSFSLGMYVSFLAFQYGYVATAVYYGSGTIIGMVYLQWIYARTNEKVT